MADKKKSTPKEKKEVPKSKLTDDLSKNLDNISFKNSQIKQIMSQNAAMKQQLGNRNRSSKRRQAGSESGISGLARLGTTVEIPRGYTKRR